MIALAKEGKTLTMIACVLEVHRDTLYEWAKVHPGFSDALKMAKQHQEAVMEQIGITGMTGKLKGFQAGAWIFWMKARHNWDEAGQPEDNEVEPIFD